LKHLETESRYATPVEQAVLVKYTGWGGLSEAFKEAQEGRWKERYQELKDLLSESEYRSASRSTINAHYTDPEIARRVWKVVLRLGYSGGPTLEPAAGVGHFFGVRPLGTPIEMHGIEMDSISGRIAQHLYQSADIRIMPYENVRMDENRYNLIISNVPFSEVKPYEDTRTRTPGLDGRYALHDFYFLKSLYGTRPGGIIAFITSRYTMDKESTEVREKMAQTADFVGAIRLPNNTFRAIANTEVVTDIVFLQKRSPEQTPSELTRKFITTGEIPLEGTEGTRGVRVNQYFIDNPQFVLGRSELAGTMYRANEYTVTSESEDLYGEIDKAIALLPENIMSVMIENRTRELEEKDSAGAAMAGDSLLNGSYAIGEDTRLYQKHPTTGVVELCSLYEEEAANSEKIICIMKMVTLKESLKKAIQHYYSDQPLDVQRELARMNELYDAFVKEYGYLAEKKNWRLIHKDPDATLLCSLENWNPKTKTATKADIFKGISFARKSHVTSVEKPADALVLSLSRFGYLNVPYMEAITGTEREQLMSQLVEQGMVYVEPQEYKASRTIKYVTSDDYLSGNVRKKLALAQELAEKDPSLFMGNVTALRKVLPAPLGPEDISIRINSPIVGEEHIKAFISSLLEGRSQDVQILHLSINGKWEIRAWGTDWNKRTQEYGTEDLDAIGIINLMMNGKPVKVFDKDEGDNLILNAEKTALVEDKAEAINNAFQEWVWAKAERAGDIALRYNEVFNSHVERTFTYPERLLDPMAKVFFSGCNFPFPMRPHQADAVWRILQQKNVMLAHTVGAGKTLEMICAAMELRRLGLRAKPMIVCPDHLIGQWADNFRQAYPNARLLIADDQNWHKDNRKTFINKIATGDWDAVVIRSESFKMIPVSKELQESFFYSKIAEYKQILSETDEGYGKRRSRSIKDVEKAIKRYEEKIKQLADIKQDEGVIPFDKLGVDQLMIDEADIYKNLEYYTQLTNVRGLGSALGSDRAFDMMLKVRYVQSIDGGVVFATGTPISNTLVEGYTMQRFLQPEVLKANRLEAFDEWARQYAETVTQMELNNTGTGYVAVTRFSKIVNVPELVTSLRQCWDIQTAHNLEENGIFVPGVNLPIMNQVNVAAPGSPLMKSYLIYLQERESRLRGRAEKGADNILSIMTDGRKAAIDMRLIHPSLPDDPDSKLNMSIRKIWDIYEKYKNERYATAVFFDKPRSYSKDGRLRFDAVKEMKERLAALGVEASEIADMRECKTFEDRYLLSVEVNEGKKRIIFGSTDTMGAGVNFQRLLKSIIHVDAPWRPRDIEQQNGRGYRQGNTTGTLDVYNMVTKGSLDTGLWNVLETKAIAIRQVMDGSDRATREIEENYYGSVKELSIDNPLMKEAIELDHAIKKLKSLQKGFRNEVANASRQLKLLPSETDRLKEEVEKIRGDISLRAAESKGDDFLMVLNGKERRERREAGLELIKLSKLLNEKARGSRKEAQKEVGSYAGFPLTIRATGLWDNHFAEIYAQGKHNSYGAEVRSDSDPVGLIRSLHHSIYRGMENKLLSCERMLASKEATRPGLEKMASSRFTKAVELEQKEARYKEAVEAIQEHNEKHLARASEYPFDWETLDEWSVEKVALEAQRYLGGTSTIMIAKKSEELAPSSSSIGQRVRNLYAIELPESLLKSIDEKMCGGKLKPQRAMEIVESAIRDFAARGPRWNEGNGDGLLGSYRRSEGGASVGDILIKKASGPDRQTYKAFLVNRDGSEKCLGSDGNLLAVKERARRFYIFNSVASGLRREVELAKTSDQSVSSEREGQNAGLEC
jgi:N12 class adenine-specific DNA methylase